MTIEAPGMSGERQVTPVSTDWTPPLVLGGQGRSEAEVRASGHALAVMLALGLAIAVVAATVAAVGR